MSLFVVPENAGAEEEVLGSCRRDPRLILQVSLTEEDFVTVLHGRVFKTMKEMGEGVTITRVHDKLKSDELYVDRGEVWLKEIEFNAHPSALRYNIDLLKENTRKRTLLDISSCMQQDISEGADSIAVLGDLRESILRLQREMDPDEVDVPALVKEIVGTIEKVSILGDMETGIATGFLAFDAGGGLETGLHSIHGMSGVGKTALATNIDINVLHRYVENHVLHYSFEGSPRSIIKRMLSRQSKIKFQALRRNGATQEQILELRKLIGSSMWPRLHIIENTKYAMVSRLIAHAEATALKNHVGLVVVDHLQLLETGGRQQNRHLEVSKITRDLSFLAKRLDVPVIVLSQVNEEGEAKESRDVKAHSTCYFSLARGREPENMGELVPIKVSCLKGRDTGVWVKWLEFDGDYMVFRDCEKPDWIEEKKSKRIKGNL
jgi:replicative DNA helicase